MDRPAALAYLDRHIGRGVKPGLERIKGLLEMMGNPQEGYPVIHVAGTNGKTSTSRMAAALLSAHGLTPGLFTSPHLQRVEERFEVGGKQISAGGLGSALADLKPFVDLYEQRTGDGITYFELTAALAFSWFAEMAVDVAVVEVGLGGRLDATNVVDAEVSVVTSIGLEHTEYLGDTLGAIAGEKVAILSRGRTLVTGELESEALEAVSLRVAATGASWFRYGHDFRVAGVGSLPPGWMLDLEGVHQEYPGIRLLLHGRHQTDNFAVAVASVEALFGRALDPAAVLEAAAAVRTPGRMEVVRERPLLMLDGAHNPAGMEALVSALLEEHPGKQWAVVFGAMVDKDLGSMLALLEPVTGAFFAAAADAGRARAAAEVAAVASATMTAPVSTWPSVEAALAAAAAGGGPVLVTGSLYVVGEARGVVDPRMGA
jgi:dihydrofolate synthase/folylpolyglutamate synthase